MTKESMLAAILRCPEPEATRRLVIRLSDARFRTELKLVNDDWIDSYAAIHKITPWSIICSDPDLIRGEDFRFYLRLFLTTATTLLPEISEIAGKDYAGQGKFCERVSCESGLAYGPDNQSTLTRYIIYRIITFVYRELEDKSGATAKRYAEAASATISVIRGYETLATLG